MIGKPDADRHDLEGGEEVVGPAVVSGGEASELLDPVEEPFDEVALPIDGGINWTVAVISLFVAWGWTFGGWEYGDADCEMVWDSRASRRR